MTAKFFAILTNQGAARLANATALGTKLNLTQLAVGDGGGTLPVPDPAQTALLGEKRRAALNLLSVDPNNTSQIIAEQIIPENEGGFWIREIGLYDDAGVLIAVANCPETYKPQLQEGSGRTQTIRMVLIVSSTAAVTLKIDPSVVLATRKYVDDRVIEVKAYADNLLAQHLAAVDPHPQYAPKNSPALTGRPTAPTAAQTENSTQLATTGFVKAALATLVASSPEQLDTLNELAAALGNDANFAATMTAALAGKQPLNATLTALAGKDVAGILKYLGSGDGTLNGRLINVQTFTASGTYTPTPGTKSIIVEATGGGGASGNLVATSSTTNAISSAAGNGSYAKARYTSGFSGVAVVIGAGGVVNGSGGGNGGNGGTTTFGSLLTCPGGNGSQVGTPVVPPVNAPVPTAATDASGSGIIYSVRGYQPAVSAIVALGMALNFMNIITPPLGVAGKGGDGRAANVSASAQNGNVGGAGLVIISEYA